MISYLSRSVIENNGFIEFLTICIATSYDNLTKKIKKNISLILSK